MQPHHITTAVFVKSSRDVQSCPPPQKPEYAFTGRSNVGKSSLINMLTSRKKLAVTSATPGKTQMINHFEINRSWYLADLPGLGYARTSKKNQKGWEKMIFDYLVQRKNLLCTFVLVDSRHAPQQNDVTIINNMGSLQLPFVIVLTKADKISPGVLKRNIQNYRNHLMSSWEELPLMITSSVKTGAGRDALLSHIEKTNKIFHASGPAR